MTDRRVPEWGRLSRRPTIAVEASLPGPAAVRMLADVARRRWRVSAAERAVRLKDPVALAVNLLQLVLAPTDFWRSSVIDAEAVDDGIGGCRVEVVVTDHGSVRLRRRTATLLSDWVAVMEAGGTPVRTGLWRAEVLDGDAPDEPQSWYGEGSRLAANAGREAEQRTAPGPFTLGAGAPSWAADLTEACGVAAEPLTPATARAWMDGLVRVGATRVRQAEPAFVVDALVQAALRAGVLHPPEPGVLRLAFAGRDPDGDRETAWGWGFKPASTAALTWHATRPCDRDELTTQAVGGDAVVEVLGVVVTALGSVRVGPVDALRCW